MAGIFISYRRDDSAGHAGRLFDRLKEQFGSERVFMDVEGIAPGADFVQAIDRAVNASQVVLAVIGPEWLSCKDEHGQRRLADAGDFVRLEIAAALRRDKVVIPVLVHDAEMPTEEALPSDIQALARRQGVALTDAHWDSDVAQLTRTLQSTLERRKQTPAGWWQTLMQLFAKPLPLAAVALLAAGVFVWRTLLPPSGNIASVKPPPPAAHGADDQRDKRAAVVEAPQARLRASAEALDFGSLRIGEHDVLQVRILNSGEGAADISRIGVAGEAQDDYSIEHRCAAGGLAPNDGCELSVRFVPSEPGARKALLSVEYFGRASPLIVKLWGSGASKGEALSSAATPR